MYVDFDVSGGNGLKNNIKMAQRAPDFRRRDNA